MSEKLCVFCKHLDFDSGGYGEYADAASMNCKLFKWYDKEDKHMPQTHLEYGLNEFRLNILKAETCPDYERPT